MPHALLLHAFPFACACAGTLRPLSNPELCAVPSGDTASGAQISTQRCVLGSGNPPLPPSQMWVRLPTADGFFVSRENETAVGEEGALDELLDEVVRNKLGRAEEDDSSAFVKALVAQLAHVRKTQQLAWAKDTRLCLSPSILLATGDLSTTLATCKFTDILVSARTTE